jgi:hypothetical protein
MPRINEIHVQSRIWYLEQCSHRQIMKQGHEQAMIGSLVTRMMAVRA